MLDEVTLSLSSEAKYLGSVRDHQLNCGGIGQVINQSLITSTPQAELGTLLHLNPLSLFLEK